MSPVDPCAYDRVVVAFSGGKDSLAALLHLLDLGVSPPAIELHHHLVDGRGPVLMDWPITPAYVAALATGWLGTRGQLTLALVAFVAYVVNAAQFVLKLRAARLSEASASLEGAR